MNPNDNDFLTQLRSSGLVLDDGSQSVEDMHQESMLTAGVGSDTMADDQKSDVVRKAPTGREGDKLQINRWLKRIDDSAAHWRPKFKQMQRDMDFAGGKQWPNMTKDGSDEDDRYVANIVQRHIRSRLDALYAKNPKFVAKRRPMMDFKIWDEDPQSIQMAMQGMQMAQQAMAQGIVIPPAQQQMLVDAQALIADVQAGSKRRKMMDKISRTMELMMAYQVAEQLPPFKQQMKQAIRRTLTTSVSWVKLGLERILEPRPDDVDKIRDFTTQLTELERQMADMQDDENRGPAELQMQELEDQIKAVQGNPNVIVREGLVFDFPSATAIIIDKRCRQLQGFVGAQFIAQQFDLTPADVERIYKVDVRSMGFTEMRGDDNSNAPANTSGRNRDDETEDGPADGLVRVYEVQDKQTRQMFTIADGCPVYLREPDEPEVRLDRFWNLFAITFNDIENEKQIYPQSDVEMLRHQQMEHNRSREALREHRRAAAPGYVTPRGMLTDTDKALLADHEPHETIELDGLAPGQKVGDVLQGIPKQGIDPNLYETRAIFDDVLKVVGQQEANIGGTSGATATEVSTAEGSRLASVSSNVDDLDDFFTEFARASSQVLLAEISPQSAVKMAGPGATWPELTSQEIADELYMEVQAGSSGKPNRALDVKNYMTLAPILMQVPGIKPEWLAREGIRRMDDSLDLTDAFLEGLPSMAAQNAQKMAAGGTGDPAADPNMQGGAGANNTPTAAPGNPQPNENPVAGGAIDPGQGLMPNG